jgi:putative PIN family toxin of toxin-antitoxin system
MRVLIDTNVLVSAALQDKDPEAVIKWVVVHPDWLWLATHDILAEYKAVLNRPKFGLPRSLLERWFALLDEVTTLTIVDVDVPIEYPRDHKDAMFLSCAVAAQADYLITGDRDFAEARRLLVTTILSVSQFKRLVCDVIS